MRPVMFRIFITVISVVIFCGCSSTVLKFPADGNAMWGYPQKNDCLIIERRGYAMGYHERMRHALWVSYLLTAENLRSPQVPRPKRFLPDPAIKNDPVHPGEYTRSGYDRGHLAPSADMTYSRSTAEESFYMSNISPQLPALNRRGWKNLESAVRSWALKEGKLYVITGPIFSGRKTIGRKHLAVPAYFYKIILDMTPPEKMIAFIMPNKPAGKNLEKYAVTVDEVEKITGFDFFSEMDDETEKKLESRADYSAWK